MFIAHIILPLALDTYTYGIPLNLADKIVAGMRVGVSMRQQVLVGVVLRIQKLENNLYDENLAPILFILDEEAPLVQPKQLELWEWIAQYYMCPLGLVLRYALPSSFLPTVKTWVHLQDKLPQSELTLEAYTLQIYLQQKPRVIYNDLLKKFPLKTYKSAFEELFLKDGIQIHKEIQSSYKPLYEQALMLHKNYQDLEHSDILESYQNRGNIYAVLQIFLKLYTNTNHQAIPIRLLSEYLGKNIRVYVNKLINDGLLIKLEIPRLRVQNSIASSKVPELARQDPPLFSETPTSQASLIFTEYEPIELLSIYYYPIQKLLAQGKQVLFIYPEDYLPSKQEKETLQSYYGRQIIFLTKHNNTNERHEIWEYIGYGQAGLICSNSSGLHLPFVNLGAIFLADEPSHTRRRPNLPYLNTRDLALLSAKIWKIPILMFSAMPSSDSIYQIELNKFRQAEITTPPSKKQVKIEHISLYQNSHNSEHSTWLSEPVFQAIKQAKADGTSIVLFQNRIGYAPYIICKSCNWIAKCQHCNAGLTYFKKKNELRCRYCAKQYQVYNHCPICLANELEERKFGTEKVEISLEKLFPNYNILRVDKEILQHKGNYQNALDIIHTNSQVDIFVGTMALIPLLRTRSIGTVAILDTDALLQAFDFNFRYLEQGFRLLLQIKQLLLRSTHPQPRLMLQEMKEWDLEQQKLLENSDFNGFIYHELKLRKQFNLPPICKMLRIQFKYKQADISLATANLYAQELNTHFPEIEIIGPSMPLVSKIRDEFIYLLHLKIPRSQFWSYAAKNQLKKIAQKILKDQTKSKVHINFFIDP